jgi:hypothetical protein
MILEVVSIVSETTSKSTHQFPIGSLLGPTTRLGGQRCSRHRRKSSDWPLTSHHRSTEQCEYPVQEEPPQQREEGRSASCRNE